MKLIVLNRSSIYLRSSDLHWPTSNMKKIVGLLITVMTGRWSDTWCISSCSIDILFNISMSWASRSASQMRSTRRATTNQHPLPGKDHHHQNSAETQKGEGCIPPSWQARPGGFGTTAFRPQQAQRTHAHGTGPCDMLFSSSTISCCTWSSELKSQP